MKTSRNKPLVLSLAALPFATFGAQAGTILWDGIVAANPGSPWGTAANWSTVSGATTPDPGAAPATGDDLVFNISGTPARSQIYLEDDQAAQSMTFNSPGGVDIFANFSDTNPRNLILGAGGVTLNPGSGQVIFSGASATFGTINVQIDVSQTWKNNSTGLLSLYGNNATAATIASGAVLTFDGSGPIQVGPNSTTLANLTGAGSIVKSGSGMLTLFSNGTYSGGTTLNAGTIAVGHAGALGTGGSLTINGGTLRADANTARSLAGKLTGITVNSNFTVGDSAATGALTFDAPVNLGSATRTITVLSGATFGGAAAGVISGGPGVGLIKNGGGTLTINGNTAHTFDGGLTVNGGALLLSLANMTTPANLLPAGSTLALANSPNVSVNGKAATASTQTLGNLSIGAGRNSLSALAGSGSTLGLTLGNTWNRTDSGALHLVNNSASGVTITSSPALTKGIVGPWASIYQTASPAGSYYATVSGGNVVPLTEGANFASVAQSSGLTDTTGTINYDLTATGTAPDDTVPAGFAGNTVRFAGTVSGSTLPGGSFSANGLMNASNTNGVVWTIGAGTLTIGSDRELVVNTNTRVATNGNGMIINATIADNGAGASGLTMVGLNTNTGTHPAGLTLSNTNTYSGKTVINGTGGTGDGIRTLVISALRDSGVSGSEFGTGTDLVLNNAIVGTGATGTSDRGITLAGSGGFYVKGSFAQTLSGSISGPGNLSSDGDFASGTLGGTGNLILSGDNSFTGDMLLQADGRVTLAHADALKNATLAMSGVRILADLTTHNLAYNIGGLRGQSNLNLGTGIGSGGSGFVSIGSNHQSNAYAGILSGSAGLKKTGNGTQTLLAPSTYTGSTIVDAGTLKFGATATSSQNGSGGSGAVTITALASTANLTPGQAVTGVSVGAGAKIVSIDSATQVTVSVAHAASFSASAVTFGALNGSLASPSIEVKSGAVLDAASTGTLTTGDISFAATGSYDCSLNGPSADSLAAGILTVDPAAKITFTGIPTAGVYVIATYSGPEPVHFATDASLPAGYALDYSTPGQIKLVGEGGALPYDAWAASKGLAGADATAAANPDHDSLDNAIEFVVGGEPNPLNANANSNSLLPTGASTASNLVFTFRRTDLAMSQPGMSIVVRYGSNLSGWTDVTIPATTPAGPVNGATITITNDGFGAGVDKVDVSIPKTLASGARLFARLVTTP